MLFKAQVLERERSSVWRCNETAMIWTQADGSQNYAYTRKQKEETMTQSKVLAQEKLEASNAAQHETV